MLICSLYDSVKLGPLLTFTTEELLFIGREELLNGSTAIGIWGIVMLNLEQV